MKKLISMILAAAMMLSVACFMTACGDADTTSNTSVPTESENLDSEGIDASETFPEALQNIQANQIDDLSNTGWEFAGGMIDGVEMEQADADAILAACGGKFQIIFLEDNKVQLVNGEQAFDGTFELMNDNYIVNTKFDGYEYYGALTEVGENLVLILVKTDAPETAFYMSLISES